MTSKRTSTLRPAPIPSLDAEDVRVLGQPLDRVLWTGKQWAVTEHGIECRDGRYVIKKDRLRENERLGLDYSWAQHMRDKRWVDIDDFELAFAVACFIHLGEPFVSPNLKAAV